MAKTEVCAIETPDDPSLPQGQQLASPPPQTKYQDQGTERQGVGQDYQQPPYVVPPHIDVTVSGNVGMNAEIKGGNGGSEKGKGFYDI